MFSIQKLAVFAVIVAAIWLAFRYVGNLEKTRKARDRLARPGWRERFRRRRGARKKAAAREPAGDVEMVVCGTCGDYVAAAGARACGRAACPYPPSA